MPGILADHNIVGQVEYLARLMQANPWLDFWTELELDLRTFSDVALDAASSDREIWDRCQSLGLILITDNRNADTADSLE